MVQPIVMPKLGQTVEESTIVCWLKQEGEEVTKGDILFEIETDKAILEVESFFEGTLLKIAVPEGQTVPVLSVVGFMGDPGEPIPEVTDIPAPPQEAMTTGLATESLKARVAPASRQMLEARPATKTVPEPEVPPVEKTALMEMQEEVGPARFKISPRAAKLARESVIDPRHIQGTGPGGRVIERDIEAYLESRGYYQVKITPAAKRLAAQHHLDILSLQAGGDAARIRVADVHRAMAEKPKPMTKMRQVIAERLTQSFTTTPHFFVTVSVDMTDLVSLRSELKDQGRKYTVSDFILKAVALTLPEFPMVNSTTDGKNVRRHCGIHLGLAVSLEDGLLVPVIRDADALTLVDIHNRGAELVGRSRIGKLTPDEMTGSTFTISNMGMLGVENFTAIINPGESAVLAISSILKQPVVQNDQVVIRSIMKMTLSADHRIVDGALAARFLNAVKSRLEEIELWKRFV